MEEDLQGGVCGGNLWNSSRNLFASSPCSSAFNGGVGSFGWSNHGGVVVDIKTVSDDSAAGSTVLSDDSAAGSAVLRDVQKPHHLADWNQDVLGRSQENYSYILQTLNSSMNCRASKFCSMNSNQSFPIEPNSFTNSASYNLQNLIDAESQSFLDYNQMINSAQFLPSLGKVYPTEHQPANNFHFTNNTPFWNAAAAAAPAGHIPASFQRQLIPSSLSKANVKHRNEKVGDESAIKRPRVDTPSSLPAFKVRKEKLGDRVTALQQLVSPFGKTDTASVLHEAIEYIKLLHDQVTVLSTPYLNNRSPPLQYQKGADKINDQEEAMKDLRSKGLCLVPIASTFPVAAETSPDFWTPTFGGSFR
ncbi:hypothetical protein ACS0TY_018161 [Phlomoides rotata]